MYVCTSMHVCMHACIHDGRHILTENKALPMCDAAVATVAVRGHIQLQDSPPCCASTYDMQACTFTTVVLLTERFTTKRRTLLPWPLYYDRLQDSSPCCASICPSLCGIVAGPTHRKHKELLLRVLMASESRCCHGYFTRVTSAALYMERIGTKKEDYKALMAS